MGRSVRTRLLALLAGFALVAVLSAGGTIYIVRQLLAGASEAFEQSISRGLEIEQLRLAAREQTIALRESASAEGQRGRRGEVEHGAAAERDALFQRLEHLADYPPGAGARDPGAADWAELSSLVTRLRELTSRCVTLLEFGRTAEAAALIDSPEYTRPWAELDRTLHDAYAAVEATRSTILDRLMSTHARLLLLAALVGVLEAALLAVGAMLIRRWLMVPVARLRQATEEFQAGNLGFHVDVPSRDELGALAGSLNNMAQSLIAVQSELRTSEAKYRALFENLRDAVVICDDRGSITDYRDSTSGLLGGRDRGTEGPRDRSILGQDLGGWWARWFRTDVSWLDLSEQVIRQGRSVQRSDQPFTAEGEKGRGGEGDAGVWVDFVAYPVEYGKGRYMAVVLRDVTERHQLHRRARQADAIAATVTFAQGIAHDFNNLLTSAIGIFHRLRFPATAPAQDAEQFATAVRACSQAGSLARRLLDYSDYDQGHPRSSSLGEVVELILHSLDETLSRNIRIDLECPVPVWVRIDRDQLTQLVLNLARNACEAMPDGGELSITIESAVTRDLAEMGGPRPYAVLTVADTGEGMSEEVKRRLFEPFFSTRSASSPHRRGLGLAVVYAVVKNAGGFVEVQSQLGAGSRIRVFLPAESRKASPGQGTEGPRDRGTEGGEGTEASERESFWRASPVGPVGR